MKFSSEEEAKEYVISLTNKTNSLNDKSSQGIDELMLLLIEWRSVVFPFQKVKIKKNPFKEGRFYELWYLGAIYGIFSIIGKLVSKDERDNSLRKLWEDISPIMLSSKGCTEDEVNYINEEIDKESGRFSKNKSQTIKFRNKLIAHNEEHTEVGWDEVDKEIALLMRMWSLLVSWSSFGLPPKPFGSNEYTFLGLESFLERSEIEALGNERNAYIDKVKEWSLLYAHTGYRDKGRGAFCTSLFPKVTIRPSK